jgi:hypothetical protein
LDIASQIECREREREREIKVITELDNKTTLQISIKWDSTNRDKRERDKIG